MSGFSFNPKVFHHPPKVLFNSRAFDLEVFTKFDKKKIKNITLFYRTDALARFIEVSFKPTAPRYRFKYNPLEIPANRITYFFTVELKNGSVFASPVDKDGILNPITIKLENPLEYYKKRAERKS